MRDKLNSMSERKEHTMKKAVFVVLGCLFFVCGWIGAFLPVLPTTPFLLLAAACFARGSTRFNQWFLKTQLYKRYLQSYIERREMTLKNKLIICVFATTMMMIAFFVIHNWIGRIIILCLVVLKYYYFTFRIKTVKNGGMVSRGSIK